METWYETGGFGKQLVVPVKVEKSTDKSVWIDGQRRGRRSTWRNYFKTPDEAFNYLTAECEQKIGVCKQQLDRHRSRLSMIGQQETVFHTNPKP